jgi:hypothetical protein
MKRLLKLIAATFLVAALIIGIEATTGAHLPDWHIATIAMVSGPATCAFTIREFCQAHKISEAFYYVMKREGWGPAEMHAGQRVLISHEAAAEWRRAREAAAAAGIRRIAPAA